MFQILILPLNPPKFCIFSKTVFRQEIFFFRQPQIKGRTVAPIPPATDDGGTFVAWFMRCGADALVVVLVHVRRTREVMSCTTSVVDRRRLNVISCSCSTTLCVQLLRVIDTRCYEVLNAADAPLKRLQAGVGRWSSSGYVLNSGSGRVRIKVSSLVRLG